MDIVFDILRAIFTNHEVLQAMGLLLSMMVSWVLWRILSVLGIKLRADRQAMLNLAVDKAMTLGVVRAEQIIHEKGWADLDSRHEVINRAIPILEEKFRETLRDNGINLSDENDRLRMIEMMQRMLPDVFTRASASPATPPSPVVPVAVVAPTASP